MNQLSDDELRATYLELETKRIMLETSTLELKKALIEKKLKYWWLPTSDYMFPVIIALIFLSEILV